MSTATMSTEQAATRAWEIRRLYHAGAVDYLAGLHSLDALTAHANPRIAQLCQSVALEMIGHAPRGAGGADLAHG